MKRRVIVSIIGSLIFLSGVGLPALLQVKKYWIKREIKEQLQSGKIYDDRVVLLKFSKIEAQKKLRWEHEAEFEYQGQMYDILRQELRNDSLLFWCWWDKEETEINQKIQNSLGLITMAPSDHPDDQKEYHDLFKSLFCNSLTSLQFMDLTRSGVLLYLINIHEVHSIINKPPPERC